ncbi:hypothetical protein BHU72_06875 [Desulfuribacillus stibiiarsenatis]|uniref:Gas vesicle protein n=1 Tax=Desulfuribacillus stibiiarsenatis TaxID=1390249 RepID=A0A1E5L448_9FIRM|nr:YtxH domain-containing protein [Desulfuribacillus stibiiarsenatis]OEH84910.1 hypothetical protein BHU72_06875 [Desulfuribacillus stibiiarsenatis]
MSIRDLLLLSKENRIREKRKEACKNLTIGASVGLAIGTVIGVLFAPKSGKETREQIAAKAKESVEITKETLEDSKAKILQFVEEQKEKITALKNEACCEVATAIEQEDQTVTTKKKAQTANE